MEKISRPARRYLRQTGSWLPCAGSMKRKMLGEIRETLLEFLAENPDADYPAITARFGAPGQIAAAYVDEAETGELLNRMRLRRRVVSIACAAAIAVVSIWVGAIAYMINSDAHHVENFIVEVTIDESK